MGQCGLAPKVMDTQKNRFALNAACLLYTSDAADE